MPPSWLLVVLAILGIIWCVETTPSSVSIFMWPCLQGLCLPLLSLVKTPVIGFGALPKS